MRYREGVTVVLIDLNVIQQQALEKMRRAVNVALIISHRRFETHNPMAAQLGTARPMKQTAPNSQKVRKRETLEVLNRCTAALTCLPSPRP